MGHGHTRLFNTIRNMFLKKWVSKYADLGARTFGITKRRVKQILQDDDDEEQKLMDLLDNKKKREYRSGKEDPHLWVNKLNDVLVKKSGERSETLRSRWGKLELYELFVKGWYAECLDRQISNDPSLIESAKKSENPTRFQRNIRALVDYKIAKGVKVVEWNPDTDLPIPGLKCVSSNTFFTALSNLGLKLYIDYTPHNCPICKQISEVNDRIKKLRSGELKSENVEADLQAAVRKREGIYLHEAQLHNQRGEVEKIKQKLNYEQCLVVSDFCGHYATNNKKVYQLIFVIYYRNRDSGHIEWKYHSVWGKQKATWDYVVRSWEMLFKEKVFDDYDEIFLARDNGPHFRNYNVIKYESEIGYLHKKTLRVRSYPPYHGYSHADRHASLCKVTIRTASVTGKEFKEAEDFVTYLNKVKPNQKSFVLDTKMPLPNNYNEIKTKAHWQGILRCTHRLWISGSSGAERVSTCALVRPRQSQQ